MVYLLKMVIFYSYVKLPEGKSTEKYRLWMKHWVLKLGGAERTVKERSLSSNSSTGVN